MESCRKYSFVVIGGGIAGVSCAETLCQLNLDVAVALISSSALVKAAINVQKYGHTLESMEIDEIEPNSLMSRFSNLHVIHSTVKCIDSSHKVIRLKDGDELIYERLCIATGGQPKLLHNNPYVLSIRDTESVQIFLKRLKNSRKIIVIGNGGIATELVHEVSCCDIIWAIKDESISTTFFDVGAAQFFLPHLNETATKDEPITKRWIYESSSAESVNNKERGSALGPDWSQKLNFTGANSNTAKKNVHVEYRVEIKSIMSPEELSAKGIADEVADCNKWPVYVQLSNGKIYGADTILNATGVEPNINLEVVGEQLKLASDGGVIVDTAMRTNLNCIYAAGDICSTSLWNHSNLWLQIRLWTQAKQMGCFAAKCMINDSKGEDCVMDFCFELFSHVTKFFGYKVVLLGLFNAQGLNKDDYSVLIRCTRHQEYVKVILQDGRVVGGVFIGDTDLEETFENLILNQLDVRHLQDNLLDPDIDIEDYFD